MVLELYVSNTVQGIVLENIEAKLTGLAPNFVEIGAAPIEKLENGGCGSAYVVIQRQNPGEDVVTASIGAALRFIVKEEGDDLGYDDDYPVEAIQITIGDYMFPRPLQQGQFKSVWEQLQAQGVETVQKLALNFKSLEAAVEGIANTLNMEPCDKTNKVEAGVRGHTLNMSGTFSGGNVCLVTALVGMDPNHGCVAKLRVRAKNQTVCDTIARALC